MKLHDVLHIMMESGLSWVWWRCIYEAALRTGVLKRRFKHQSVDSALSSSLNLAIEDVDRWLLWNWHESRARFFIEPNLGEYKRYICAPERVIEVADNALDGSILFFNKWQAELGWPPNWLFNPVSGVQHRGDLHWTRVPDLDEDMGDIKYVWEASRFPQVFYFVRAYALTNDERYPEGFWSQFESWVKANPTELGPNWRCGQEIAIRSFAWLFALYAFKESKASTEYRVALMLKYLWYNAWHIEKNFWYALKCVRNNHSLSEAAGLFTIGTTLPFFPEANRWRRKGFNNFISEAMWQIYSDGTYVQHSTNYSRLVIQLFTWCTQVARLNGQEFPDKVNKRFGKLLSFLMSLQDEETGRLPNYGSNDGALILPLSSCDYLDYRPSLNALSEVLDSRSIYEEGPWIEETVWLRGPQVFKECADNSNNSTGLAAIITGEKQAIVAFPEGGYYTFRSQDLFAMIRCGEYHHRPAQADMLHLDVWYKGHNVLIDPGTYSYNPGEGWSNYFIGTQSHNTISVDGLDQMKKGSRFLWADWVHGKTIEFGQKGSTYIFMGEHRGYAPIVHRRLVALRENTLVVLDYLFGDAKNHEYTLHWLINDFELFSKEWGAIIDVGGQEVLLRTGCSHKASTIWVRADEKSKCGWQSLYYGEKLPAWSYKLNASSTEPVSFFTVLKPLLSNEPLTSLAHEDINTVLEEWGVNYSDYLINYPGVSVHERTAMGT